MGDKVFNVLGSIVLLAIVTTLVLPDRQTPAVINAGAGGFIGSIQAAMGFAPTVK
jgi:hypothetical protein